MVPKKLKKNIIRAIIIDDQQPAINSLKQDLAYLFPNDIQIIGESTTINQGVILFKETKPDLIFLDIDLTNGTGFDFIHKIANIEHTNYEVIFVTAFNQFAIKAIKLSAFDYLLKPIDPDELTATLNRLIKDLTLKKEHSKSKIELLIENSQTHEYLRKKIALPTQEKIHFVQLSDIYYCESQHNYTQFFLNNGKKILVSKTIKEFEQMLSNYDFIRPHQRFIVNNQYIESYVKEDGGFLVLNNNIKIPVSRRKKDTILKLLSKF